ncbi:MAG: response regulator [Planctomycetota bacterium]
MASGKNLAAGETGGEAVEQVTKATASNTRLAAAAQISESGGSLRPVRVHLVDDGDAIRKSIGGWLGRYGYTVATSSDLPEFLADFEKMPADLVLIDLVLPHGSGLAGLEKIRALDPKIPVVVITGQPSFESAAQALRLGAYDYIPKPVDKSQLLAVVARAVEYRNLELEKERLERENTAYRNRLADLVIERTQQLAASEEKYRLGFIHSLDAILVLNRDGRILDANPAAAELAGLPMQQLQGKLLEELAGGDILEAFRSWRDRLVSAGKCEAERLALKHAGGRVIPIEVFGSQLGPSIFQAVARDITPRLEAEKILEEKVQVRTRELGRSEERTRNLADELEDKNRILEHSLSKLQELQRFRDNLFHMILHDVRTPLSVATVGLDLVLQGKLDDQQGERLRKCRQALLDVGDMLGQMLDIERLEDGRLPVELGAVQVREAAEEVNAELADLAAVKNLRIALEAGELPAVLADAGLLRRILRNLMLNAIRHACPHTTIQVGARVVDVSVGAGSESLAGVEVTITDAGGGVAAEYTTTIFEKFGAANLRMKRSGATPSVGLGLAFCRLAARAMFGEVYLQRTSTVPPTGSTFALQLRQA